MRHLPFLLLLVPFLPAQEAAYWNQWRGPERDGQFTGPTWPARLTAENFKQSWRVPLGPSYSGPVVDAERVYTTETVDKRYEVVRAFDRRDLIRDISTVLSTSETQVTDISSRLDEMLDEVTIRLKVRVRDFEQLSELLSRLGNVTNVIEARRLRHGA